MPVKKSKDVINVGIIGTGGIAEGAHMPGYLATPGVKVIAACDVAKERAEKFAERFLKHLQLNKKKLFWYLYLLLVYVPCHPVIF